MRSASKGWGALAAASAVITTTLAAGAQQSPPPDPNAPTGTTTTTSAVMPAAQPPPVIEGTAMRTPVAVEPEGRMLVARGNTGLQASAAPGVVFVNGDAGFSLGVRVGWGIDTGSFILVPSGRLAGYFFDRTALAAMPSLKVILPIDRWAPFVEGGIGIGHVSDPSETGAAYTAGGGLMVYIDARFAVGGEVYYQGISGTDFNAIAFGPTFAAAF